MERDSFESEMLRARAMMKHGDRPDYWAGYQRGLRRRFHGENFGTDEEHELWMNLADDPARARAERGEGYRAGYIPDYCTQNGGDCRTCSLVNYGRDCRNEPV